MTQQLLAEHKLLPESQIKIGYLTFQEYRYYTVTLRGQTLAYKYCSHPYGPYRGIKTETYTGNQLFIETMSILEEPLSLEEMYDVAMVIGHMKSNDSIVQLPVLLSSLGL